MEKPELIALVASETDYFRTLVSDLLRPAGVTRTHWMRNPTALAEGIRLLQPHLIVADWPPATGPEDVSDGLWALRLVRRRPEPHERALPVFVLTSRTAFAEVAAARDAGVTDYVTLPTSPAVMAAKVTAALRSPAPFIVSPTYTGPCRRRRDDPAYAGPLRRTADVPTVAAKPAGPNAEEAAQILAALQALRTAVAALSPIDSDTVTRVLAAAGELSKRAAAAGDAPASEGAQHLGRYVRGIGVATRLSPRALGAHMLALEQLISLPYAEKTQRVAVAASLGKMVDKKLQLAQRAR